MNLKVLKNEIYQYVSELLYLLVHLGPSWHLETGFLNTLKMSLPEFHV